MKQLSQYFFVGGGWLVAAFVSLFGTQVWPTLCLVFGLLSLAGGLVYGWRFLQAVLNLQPRRSRPQPIGNGRNVPVTAAGKTQWLSLESVAPMFGFKRQVQQEFDDWQWEVVPLCYNRKPEIVTEAYVAKMAQWIFDRQQDDETKYRAASRPAWCRDVNPHQGLYWATIGLLTMAGAIREWGTSKVLTCTPNRAVVRVKKNCPTDERLYV